MVYDMHDCYQDGAHCSPHDNACIMRMMHNASALVYDAQPPGCSRERARCWLLAAILLTGIVGSCALSFKPLGLAVDPAPTGSYA